MPNQPIGYRPPHTGQQKVAQLRAIAAAHHEEGIIARTEEDKKKWTPTKLDYAIPAIRMWEIANSGLLRSLGMGYEYEDAVAREAYPPHAHGSSGFWAVKPSGSFILQKYVDRNRVQVFGMVELSGKVIEHEYGWRAEVCTIQELYLVVPRGISNAQAAAEELSNIYQCDAYVVASFETFLRVAFE